MLCHCSCYLQKTTNTPTLNGGEGEECRFFCSLKSSYNNSVADCRKSVPFPEERCPFSKGDRYKDYVTDIFPGPNFVSPEWSYPLNRGAQKEIFHYNINYYFLQIQVIFEKEEVTAMKTFGDPGMIHCNSL